MSNMLIPGNDLPSLYKARPGDSLSSVARARTLTVLPRLDPYRKARVFQFLYESGLITRDRPVLDLTEANLSGARLYFATLSRADLNYANLRNAILHDADLTRAKLRHTNLCEADLSGAKEWNKEQLRQAKSLDGAIMPDGQLLRGLHVYFRNQPTFEAWLKDIKSREEDKDHE